MMRRSFLTLTFSAVALALASCGGSMTSNSNGTPAATSTNNATANLITISGMAFSPARLQVMPGATVTVKNLDSMQHSVTSEATVNAFRPGAVAGISFNTAPFMGQTTFMIPAGAAVGTVIPYFCTVHTSTMATPNGEIEIATAASTPTPTPMPAPMMPGVY